MERIARVISSGLPIHGPIVLKPEALTQIRAVHYAGLRLRLSRFGLFSELDSVWAELWPEARSLGQDVANIAEGIGVDDCRYRIPEHKSTVTLCKATAYGRGHLA